MPDLDRRTLIALMTAAGIVPSGGAFAAEPRIVRAPIMLRDNRIEIAVSLNGQGPYAFMIDTGTYISLIRPDLAKTLKLPVQGVERTRGVGGKGDAFTLYLASDVVIGASFRQAAVFEDSFDFGYRQGVYGALAAGMVTAFDTDLDFDAGEVRIYPDGRGERTGYTKIDAEIPRADNPNRGSRKMLAAVMVEGRPLRCELDTGSPNTLTLNQSAARRLGLWDGRPYSPKRPRGIGGTGPVARLVRVESVGLGSLTVERPVISLLGNDIGPVDGIVGLSLIRRMNLSIDVRARTLWAQPSRQMSPVERYGLSGLWLDRNGARIDVVAVGADSPAAVAGIAPGDRIEGEWMAVLRAIDGAAGDTVRLKVTRAGTTREVAFTLSGYL